MKRPTAHADQLHRPAFEQGQIVLAGDLARETKPRLLAHGIAIGTAVVAAGAVVLRAEVEHKHDSPVAAGRFRRGCLSRRHGLALE